ncbi:Threonine efflux protein [Defluviimonas aquaemixtae]|uniref:Threonine efflux protein n=1 Tax=Albidovulum aquaemixtae TaxID=1542388 RepID=A0A2R8BMD8_9RHOB|nr:LysE family translocator [Defluviimonas aquaemixtae]SPH24580.1 Threonine efflux protein [Defluviimonas aquaemixtae]
MGEYLPQLMLAWSIQVTGILSPGPSVALILAVATSHGRLPAVTTAFGVACGSIILAGATVIGISALFAEVAELMTVVRLIGAGYLLWLAWHAFARAARPSELSVAASISRRSPWRTALAGFFLQVSNPKAILFWLAIAALGGAGDAPWPVLALFVAGAFVNSFLGHAAWALFLSSGPFRRAYFRARRGIEAALGAFFAFAAFNLAMGRS